MVAKDTRTPQGEGVEVKAECVPAETLSGSKVASPDRLSELCKALGHPVRVRIVGMLLEVETCVSGDIASQLPLAQSTVSQHLKVLKEVGIVEGVIDGPRICYSLNREVLAALRDAIGAFL